MKTQLSSLEIAALANEFQKLVGGKIDQIYHPLEKEFLVSIHVPRKGKHHLKIQLPGFIYLTQTKDKMPSPSEFCLMLRRHLNNSTIKKIAQLKPERILQIDFEKEKKFKLFIELFSKGNLILTDSQKKIIALQEKQKWVEREIKINQPYLPPPASFDYFNSAAGQIKKIIIQSQKNKLVTCLATEIGLGGTYAEEICLRNKISKSQFPKNTTQEQIRLIHQTIQDFLEKIKSSQGYVYSTDITPFPLQLYKEKPKIFPSFNQALDSVLSRASSEIRKEEKESQFQEKIRKTRHIVQEQEKTIQQLGKKAQESDQKANHIYEKYQEIKKLLEKIDRAKSKMSWEDIKKELKKNPEIRQVNLKEKKIILRI